MKTEGFEFIICLKNKNYGIRKRKMGKQRDGQP